MNFIMHLVANRCKWKRNFDIYKWLRIFRRKSFFFILHQRAKWPKVQSVSTKHMQLQRPLDSGFRGAFIVIFTEKCLDSRHFMDFHFFAASSLLLSNRFDFDKIKRTWNKCGFFSRNAINRNSLLEFIHGAAFTCNRTKRDKPIIHIKNDEFNLLCSVPHSGTYDYIRRLKIKSLPSRTKPNISDAVASYCCFRNKTENR